MTRNSRIPTVFGIILLALSLSAAGPGCHHFLCPPPVDPPLKPPEQGDHPQIPAPLPREREKEISAKSASLLPGPDALPIDLLTALRLADDRNPQITVARERIREAYARQQQAEVLWLPNFEAGLTWTRHDGQIQRASGEILNVSRNALFVGGGPALSLELGDALLAPLAARQLTRASQARAVAVTNTRLLDVALTYIDLLEAHAELQINEETLGNARHLLALMESFERSGKAAAADTARARTEVHGRERERLEIEGRLGVITAKLAELLLLPPGTCLRPLEPTLVPLAIVPEEICLHDLVTQALGNRPELAENQSVAEAALQRWRAAKVAPWLPQLRLALAAGGFGGGRNSFFGDFDGRSDVIAGAVWELKNLGLGDRGLIKARRSEYAQVVFHQAGVEAQVTREVIAAFEAAFARRRALEVAQRAVVAARESYRLNEVRIRRAPEQGRPIELLQAIQALAHARQNFLQVIAEYNRAQFRLYTALGNPPLCALDVAAPLPVTEPPTPPAEPREEAPPPRPKLGFALPPGGADPVKTPPGESSAS